MLLADHIAEGSRPANQELITSGLQDQQSSGSLDELEFHKTHDDNERRSSTQGTKDPNAVAAAAPGHRRAKSSIGMNRKASGKHKEQI